MLHTAPVQLAQRCAEEALDHKGRWFSTTSAPCPKSTAWPPVPKSGSTATTVIWSSRCKGPAAPGSCPKPPWRHSWLTPTPCPSPPWKAPWIGRPPTCPTPCGAFPGPGVSLMDVHRWPITGRGGLGPEHRSALLPGPVCPSKTAAEHTDSHPGPPAAKEQKRLGPGRRGRRLSFTITETELLCFWPTVLNSRRREDFFAFPCPFPRKTFCIC